jgi:hypothetical protein
MIPEIYQDCQEFPRKNSMLSNCLEFGQTGKRACSERKLPVCRWLPTDLSTDSVDSFSLEVSAHSGQGRERINYE